MTGYDQLNEVVTEAAHRLDALGVVGFREEAMFHVFLHEDDETQRVHVSLNETAGMIACALPITTLPGGTPAKFLEQLLAFGMAWQESGALSIALDSNDMLTATFAHAAAGLSTEALTEILQNMIDSRTALAEALASTAVPFPIESNEVQITDLA